MSEILINEDNMIEILNKLVNATYEGDLRYTVTSDTIQFRDIPQHKAAYIEGLADAIQAFSCSETRFAYHYDIATNRFVVQEVENV